MVENCIKCLTYLFPVIFPVTDGGSEGGGLGTKSSGPRPPPKGTNILYLMFSEKEKNESYKGSSVFGADILEYRTLK